jgi:7-carboxy-7-deazaguanine synthase
VRPQFDPARLAELLLAHRMNVRLQLQLHTLLWPGCGRGV